MQEISFNKIFKDLDGRDNFVFLETKRITPQDYKSYLFKEPVKVISCSRPSQVRPYLNSIEELLHKGYFAAGFLSYEAGAAFEEILKAKENYDFPLLWFGIYEKPVIFDHHKMVFTDDVTGQRYLLDNLKLNISEEEYINSIDKIKSYIRKGDTYQVNYTFKPTFSFSGSISGLYLALRKRQSVSYSSLMRFGKKYIISFSPELFFKKSKYDIRVKPMKGTEKRGRYAEEDKKNRELLYLSPKNRSENIMIVDLLRNDLGRISITDTVRAKRLFEVEDYESLLQMTSTVESRVRKGVSLYELFRAIFPSGSVTGAPKIRTMQIIEELEKEPRRIYTGSIGFIAPGGDSTFNVAIRTLLIDKEKNRGEMGIGSGVLYDSDAKKEYAECRLKAEFLTEKLPDFQLIETMLWAPKREYPFLNLHLERLSESALYFNFLYDRGTIIKALYQRSLKFDTDKKYRVRLLLDREGRPTVTSSVLEEDNREKLITISAKRRFSSDRFLFHKTTNRKMYDDEYKKYKGRGFYDIIFQNEKGEITEGAISNIFIKKDNRCYTPPLECGLLNGVYRRYMLKTKLFAVREKVLYPEDVKSADEIFLTNALKGMVKIEFVAAKDLIYA